MEDIIIISILNIVTIVLLVSMLISTIRNGICKFITVVSFKELISANGSSKLSACCEIQAWFRKLSLGVLNSLLIKCYGVM